MLQGAQKLINDSPPLWLMEMEEKNLRAAGASKAAVAQFLTGCGYRAAHLSKGRWYATADPAGVKGRNIFWFNPGVAGPPAESGAPAGHRIFRSATPALSADDDESVILSLLLTNFHQCR